jgi:hypothetical protein
MHSLVSFHEIHSDVIVAGNALFRLSLCSGFFVETDGLPEGIFALEKNLCFG